MPAAYSMTFSPSTMARITRLVEAAPTFARFYLAAMNYSVNIVAGEAVQHAPVGSRPGYSGGHGRLRAGIQGRTESPWLGRVGVIIAIPYGRRRRWASPA